MENEMEIYIWEISSMNALRDHFGDVAWPAQSGGLHACDICLWGYLKSKGFIVRPTTNTELKNYT